LAELSKSRSELSSNSFKSRVPLTGATPIEQEAIVLELNKSRVIGRHEPSTICRRGLDDLKANRPTNRSGNKGLHAGLHALAINGPGVILRNQRPVAAEVTLAKSF